MVGCNGKSDATAYALFSAFSERVEIPNCEVYSYVSDSSHQQLLTKLYSSDEKRVPPAVAFCDDYLICLYNGNSVWELHIFRTVSIYDNKRIYNMLLYRRDLLQKSEFFSYYSESTQKRILEAEIITYRNFVILAVTDHNEILHDILK